jgi:predicted helicase
MEQTIREWRTNQNVDFRALPVCSDDGVRRDPDAIVSSTSELGLPVTTDPEKIAAFLRQRGPRVEQ